MKSCNLIMPKKVYYGENSLDNIKSIVTKEKGKAVIFTTRAVVENGLVSLVESQLKENGVEYTIISDMPAEPSYIQAQEIIDQFKSEKANFIIGIGGGSVLDVAKLASVLDTDEYGVKDLLNDPLRATKQHETLMIPTTAGTGAEATPNSIVLVPEENLKVGIVNPEMIADYVILDPKTIETIPSKIAAATGIDALCHNIECFTSNKANTISDTFALEGLKLIVENIENAINNPEDVESKAKMLLGSFYGGVAITTSGTTAVHALSYPLGGRFHVAHGVSNAILLIPVLRFNQLEIKDELNRIFDALYLESNPNISNEEKSEYVINEIDRIVKALDIPTSYKEFGVDESHLDELVEAGMKVTRLLNNNKRVVTPEDARKIYESVI